MGNVINLSINEQKSSKKEEYFNIALSYYLKNDYYNGIIYFELSANEGNKDAKFMLSQIKLKGIGIKKNVEEGLKSLEELSSNGDLTSKGILGLYYLKDKCKEMQGLELINEVYLTDDTIAQLAIANSILSDKSRELYEIAFSLYKRTDCLGEYYGTYSLGRCYQEGIHISKDNVQALKYFYKALKNGYNGNYKHINRCILECKDILRQFKDNVKNTHECSFDSILDIKKIVLEIEKLIY